MGTPFKVIPRLFTLTLDLAYLNKCFWVEYASFSTSVG
jgi:hypothetical protein